MIPVYLGLFLVAGSVLMLEIAITRVFSIMMWHHFTYMAVSIALLGFGAAGSLITIASLDLRVRHTDRALTLSATAYGLAVLAALFAVMRIPIDTLSLWQEKANIAALGLIYVVISLPFLLAGLTIGLALTRLADRIHRLYFADLLGSAAGGAASAFFLDRLGAASTVILAGGLGVAAGWAFAFSGGRRRLGAASAAAVSTGIACAVLTGAIEIPGLPAPQWRIPYAPGKVFARVDDASTERLPGATAEVEVASSARVPPMIGGNFGRVDRRLVEGRIVGQDGTAPTLLYEGAADLERFPFLDDAQAGSAYVALRARNGAAPRVLVIGAGGGVDVMVALAHGARKITAVEVNSAMIRAVTERFGDYIGGLFRAGGHPFSDRIELIHGEGRSFLRSRQDRYDVIQLSGVDSFTALANGAYTLSESYLYTVEAVKDFYRHLSKDGYLNYSRFILSPGRKPRETLRLAYTARVALEELGVDDPASQIVVFQGIGWASTIVKRGRFTAEEIESLDAFAEREGFWGLVFDPLLPADVPFPASARARSVARRQLDEALAESRRADDPGAETKEALLAEILHVYGDALRGGPGRIRADLSRTSSAVAAAAPDRAVIESASERLIEAHSKAEEEFRASRADFATLLGGSEPARRRFLDRYEYDVRPATDDAPFFFNYYRYSGLLSGWGEARATKRPSDKEAFHPDYPAGHAVLVASMAQIVLLAAVLILLPIRSLAARGVPTPGRWRIFVYFAALGTGFMFVEIVFMQKLILFLGHPTHAVTVVLASLLAFAGFGALLSEWIPVGSRRSLYVFGAVLVTAVVATSFWMERLLPAWLGLSFPARVAAVVALLTPVGLLLGMPFPLGMRILRSECPHLLPWSWAINGFFSVFAAVSCVVLSMSVGFSNSLLSAAGIYALGFSAMAERSRRGIRGGANAP